MLLTSVLAILIAQLIVFSSQEIAKYFLPALHAALAFAALTAAASTLSLFAARRASVRGKILALLAGFAALIVGYAVVYYGVYLESPLHFSAPSAVAAGRTTDAFDDAYTTVRDIERRLYLLSVLAAHKAQGETALHRPNEWVSLDEYTRIRYSSIPAGQFVAKSLQISDHEGALFFTPDLPDTEPNRLGRKLIAEPARFSTNLVLLIGSYERERRSYLKRLDDITRRTLAYNFFDFLYFSVVTATTVGYGDVVPVTRLARFVSMSQALLALSYVAFGLTFLWPPRDL